MSGLIQIPSWDQMTKDSHHIASQLEEIWHLPESRVRFEPEDFCMNGKIRCKQFDNDSDSINFGDQCNLRVEHEGNHAFGLDSMLAEIGNDDTGLMCTEDVHVGSCSVCLVRSVRDGEDDY